MTALEAAERARAKVEHQADVARARQVEAREGIADLERRLVTARNRLEKAGAELEQLGGIRAGRAEEEHAARAALDAFDAENPAD